MQSSIFETDKDWEDIYHPSITKAIIEWIGYMTIFILQSIFRFFVKYEVILIPLVILSVLVATIRNVKILVEAVQKKGQQSSVESKKTE